MNNLLKTLVAICLLSTISYATPSMDKEMRDAIKMLEVFNNAELEAKKKKLALEESIKEKAKPKQVKSEQEIKREQEKVKEIEYTKKILLVYINKLNKEIKAIKAKSYINNYKEIQIGKKMFHIDTKVLNEHINIVRTLVSQRENLRLTKEIATEAYKLDNLRVLQNTINQIKQELKDHKKILSKNIPKNSYSSLIDIKKVKNGEIVDEMIKIKKIKNKLVIFYTGE